MNYKDGYVSVPNKELMDKFAEVVQREPSLGNVYKLTKESGRSKNEGMGCALKESLGKTRSIQDASLQWESLIIRMMRISGMNVRWRCCGRDCCKNFESCRPPFMCAEPKTRSMPSLGGSIR